MGSINRSKTAAKSNALGKPLTGIDYSTSTRAEGDAGRQALPTEVGKIYRVVNNPLTTLSHSSADWSPCLGCLMRIDGNGRVVGPRQGGTAGKPGGSATGFSLALGENP